MDGVRHRLLRAVTVDSRLRGNDGNGARGTSLDFARDERWRGEKKTEIPAFAGMTVRRMLLPLLVIPAKAGIHGRRPA
jgi:hypothetical protein